MLKKLILTACMLTSSLTMAGSYGQSSTSDSDSETKGIWRFSGTIGVSKFKDMMETDGNTIFTRLAIGADLWRTEYGNIGLELGAQTVNHMRLNLTAVQLTDLGDTIVSTTISGAADLLMTYEYPFNVSGDDGANYAVFVKAGVAYRTMHTDRDTINTLKKTSPELQLGFNFDVGEHSSISIAYQGIFSGKMELVTNTASGGTGIIKNIPSQNGALISFNYHS